MSKDLIQHTHGLKADLPQLMPYEIGICEDTNEAFFGSGDGNKNIPLGAKGEDGKDGKDGANGVTFTPHVSSDGTLSFTNDGGLENPALVNIKGDKGDKGEKGDTGPAGKDADITDLVKRIGDIDTLLTLVANRTLKVEGWDDIVSVSVTTSNTGAIDDCFNFISGEMVTVWGKTIPISTSTPSHHAASWGYEKQSTMTAYLSYDGSLYLVNSDYIDGEDYAKPEGTIGIPLADRGKTYTYTASAPITAS